VHVCFMWHSCSRSHHSGGDLSSLHAQCRRIYCGSDAIRYTCCSMLSYVQYGFLGGGGGVVVA